MFPSNENATLFLWVTWDSPSGMCRGNSKKSSFPYSLETSIFERFRRSHFPPRIRRLTFAVSQTMQCLSHLAKWEENTRKNVGWKITNDKLPWISAACENYDTSNFAIKLLSVSANRMRNIMYKNTSVVINITKIVKFFIFLLCIFYT